MMNILFVCNQGMHRSRTAAEIFSKKFNTKYAGIYNNQVTEEQLMWADRIIVMESGQRKVIADRFPDAYMKKQIISLEIPDSYSYNQPELVEILNERFNAANQ